MKYSRLRIIPFLLFSAFQFQGAEAAVIGILGNFDVINDTGNTAHGFEIDLEGVHQSDITDVFGGPGRWFPTGRGFDSATSVERYGAPSIAEYSNGATFGTKITYYGIYSGGAWDYGTPAVAAGQFATPGDNCWSGGGLGYSAATPCDHFGVGTRANPTKTTYSWLFDSVNSPGTLVNTGGTVSLPAPVWKVIPAPPAPAGQPQPAPLVVAQVQAPAPVPDPVEPQFGDAIWVKVMTTELSQDVALEQLVGDNQIIKNAVTETEWQLLQKDPGNPNSGVLESGYGAPVGPNAASIIRRYEFYKYAGDYNAADHQALFTIGGADVSGGNDSNPGANNELVGNFIGAQNAAALLDVNANAVSEPPLMALMLGGVMLAAMARRKK